MKKVFFLVAGSFIFFALLILIVSLAFPSHVRVSRAIDLQVSSKQARIVLGEPIILSEVFNKNFSPIAQSISDSTFHAVGNKSATIQMETGWQLIDGRSGTSTLQWYIDFYFDWYPWERFASLLVESRYGNVLEQKLQWLKNRIETTY
jgi:hypothetical protein